MHKVNLGKLIAVVIAVVIIAVASFNPIKTNMNLGLDLRGGLHVVLEAVDTPDNPVTDEKVNDAKAILENRINGLGVKEPIVQREGDRRILIQLAGVNDPEEAARIIGKTAVLEFKTADGKTIVTGKELKDARAQLNQAGQAEVHIQFDAEGAQKFADATAQNVGKQIGIYLDQQMISNPRVSEAIPNGQAVISGGYQNLQQAENEAVLLRSGSLPVNLETVEKRTVGPYLGQDSLQKSFKASLIGIAAICLFMLLFYRSPGMVAILSLILYSSLVLGVMVAIHATLTLPGIAGFILSIGMAVDANIIIYERVKEELRAGKTLVAAIDSGFSHAFWTIFDANITTLIGAGVLLYFGTGLIKGFAVTLSIGIILSMFTAITFSRMVLRLLASSRLITNPKYYGI